MVPSGAGLGSWAAVTRAAFGPWHGVGGAIAPRTIAGEGFEVEHEVQGRASPIDTSTASAGGGLLVLPKPQDGLLWTIKRDARQWCLHRTDLPAFDFVIGNTGISAATGPLVANVKERVDRSPETANAVREIGRITLDGLDALRRNDLVAAGRLMDRNHTLLNQLGVGHPMLYRLVQAARGTSYGAKLTGAGGGGRTLAPSVRPAGPGEPIRRAGGKAVGVTSDPIGVASLS